MLSDAMNNGKADQNPRFTRRRSLVLIGAGLLIPSCNAKALTTVRIGSTRSSENATIAEIYAATLKRENIAVERHTNLGDGLSLMDALQRGEIDLYPGYVATRAQNMPANPPPDDAAKLYAPEKMRYERRYGITWLNPSPLRESPCLATSQRAAEQYWMLTLTTCAKIAHRLRFAATADFLASGGALQRLRNFYGGFRFKTVLTCDPGTQYYALNRGDADVANIFTTDAAIGEDQLVVLADDRHFWQQYTVAPVIRLAAIDAHPRLRSVLNHISQALTDYAVQQLNMRRQLLDMDAHDAAADFVTTNARQSSVSNGF